MNISEESQKIQIERTTPETLSIRLTGKWILDEGLPSTEETEKIIASDTRVKRIEFDAKEISAWDSGLLVFLRKIANYCKKKQHRARRYWTSQRSQKTPEVVYSGSCQRNARRSDGEFHVVSHRRRIDPPHQIRN